MADSELVCRKLGETRVLFKAETAGPDKQLVISVNPSLPLRKQQARPRPPRGRAHDLARGKIMVG
ncbi:hypothetical protein ACFFUT_01530 [Pseudohalocynthiibacter aestuariivivens]|uniref:Uncharacterized protein n=1 Tax=Pseudohalocynthiibacter aestuariivivens TaxID=1591409 RepID=A0ABV5JAI1_9RHOB|nr:MULTISPECIES: hypothetical protein [Pseudohalocynthiibacter]MBS9715977.1 hypothetical protein [Pseudohalocynthiibacter aestuariivivens]MCK0102466.1 hypothetical protein [Pseudohalocynthiibacter sp. F2068]